MAHFTAGEANAWLEDTKLSLDSIDTNLEQQIAAQILPRLTLAGFNTAAWTNDSTTPQLIRSLMAMLYVAWIYDRAYSDNNEDATSNYASLLRQHVELNIAGLVAGSIILTEEPDVNTDIGQPSFFPNDASSNTDAGFHVDPSQGDGPPAFMMGTVF